VYYGILAIERLQAIFRGQTFSPYFFEFSLTKKLRIYKEIEIDVLEKQIYCFEASTFFRRIQKY